MAGETKSLRFAVLIDADNASPQIAAGLFEEIAELGEATVRRIYGDFSSSRLNGWSALLARHAILAHQQFANTTGKNASDIALVIDAMDLLHSGRVDGFCLVSSDSDFTRLASRIREEGLEVYGFGEKKTPESFRQACKRFIYTENLMGGGAAAAPVEPIAPGTAASAGPPVPPADPAAATRAREPVQNAVPMLRNAVNRLDSDDGWVGLSGLGQMLRNLAPDYDPRNYGCRNLLDLLQKTEAFELRQSETKHWFVRIPAKKPPPPKPRA
ncbi:MAG: NYN domain-containing protein [Alphaproteobacteria bacterium]|nr:NYN domain-containing protein [Alphaproteobacteria bacterium]